MSRKWIARSSYQGSGSSLARIETRQERWLEIKKQTPLHVFCCFRLARVRWRKSALHTPNVTQNVLVLLAVPPCPSSQPSSTLYSTGSRVGVTLSAAGRVCATDFEKCPDGDFFAFFAPGPSCTLFVFLVRFVMKEHHNHHPHSSHQSRRRRVDHS